MSTRGWPKHISVLSLRHGILTQVRVIIKLSVRSQHFRFIWRILRGICTIMFKVLHSAFFTRQVGRHLSKILIDLITLVAFPLRGVRLNGTCFNNGQLFTMCVVRAIRHISMIINIYELTIMFVLPMIRFIRRWNFFLQLYATRISRVFVPFVQQLCISHPRDRRVVRDETGLEHIFPFFRSRIVLTSQYLLRRPDQLRERHRFLFSLFSRRVKNPFLSVVKGVTYRFNPLISIPAILRVVIIVRLHSRKIRCNCEYKIKAYANVDFRLFSRFKRYVSIFFRLVFRPNSGHLSRYQDIFHLSNFCSDLFINKCLVYFRMRSHKCCSTYSRNWGGGYSCLRVFRVCSFKFVGCS